MHLQKLEETLSVPEGTTVEVDGSMLVAKGEKGEISRKIGSRRVAIRKTDDTLVFTAENATRKEKRSLRTARAHAQNMMRGVSQGHVYKLKICSGHFPMNVALNNGVFEVKNFIGEKVPRTLKIDPSCEVTIQGEEIVVESADKEAAGRQAAAIELLTRRPGFDTRVFQDGIFITEKDGKEV